MVPITAALTVFQVHKSSYPEQINQVSANRPTRIVLLVTFLAVGVNTFRNYDSHYHDCHDNFKIFCKDDFNKKTLVCETRNFSQCTKNVRVLFYVHM